MTSENQQNHQDFSNQTVLSTPQPRASSTTQKQQITKQLHLKKVPFSYTANASADFSTESLGSIQPRFTNEKLQQQRTLASSLLEKTTKGCNLPSYYLKASDTLKLCESPILSISSESTVNESDLLRPFEKEKEVCNMGEEKLSFSPEDISTPRASYDSFRSRRSIDRTSISKSLAELSEQIRNSDTSLSELCEQFSKLDSMNFTQGGAFNEESFVGGELAMKKIIEQEQSWRREHDALGANSLIKSDSILFQSENFSLSRQERSSVTEFFRKKSELAELCLKDSPEKDGIPMPLIDKSVTYETLKQSAVMQNITANSEYNNKAGVDDSVLSITEIEKAIASDDNITRLMEYMFDKPIKHKTNDKQTQKASKNSKQYTIDTKENRGPYKISSDTAKLRSSSVEPLRDYRNNVSDKSSSSLRTASSLESLPGGKLPIESNRIELVWGCVPVGKRKTQTFIMRNKSQNKLRLQLCTSSANFKIVNDRAEAEPTQVLPILLYPAESRLFSVSFSPTAIGAAVEKLSFTPTNSNLQMQQTKRQQLCMYGYGGYANVEIQNVLKDTNMKMWLALGKLDDKLQLSQQFTVVNVGTLTAFGCFSFNSKALYGYSKVTLYPTEVVLKPKEQCTITVTYTPTKDDVKHVFAMATNQIIETGSIQVITGAEPLRGRIRRLCKKLKYEGGAVDNPLVEKLSNRFPNEKMPFELNKFTETVGCMKELMQNLVCKEIILTLEKDSNCTLIGQIAGIDESSMFHSLAEGMSTVIANTCLLCSCSVEPTTVVLTPPTKIEDNIIVTSHNVKSLQYQTSLSDSDVIRVTPAEGMLLPGETILLKISCDVRKVGQLQQQKVYKLSIYVDDDVFDVDIKIILVKSGLRK